jgi:aspartate kinase
MICVLDDRTDKIEKLALAASEFFDINVTKGLTLLTIRHYTRDIYDNLTTGRKMLLQQRTNETVQALLQ